MILETINSPKDLRTKNLEELKLLSRELRDYIIDVVSKTGGHLASSLGAVELCIALHYCCNTPEDEIVFDVGHQTYAHKIITGRKKDFLTLRSYQGLSGFPNFNESIYDCYISGHASTAISWAQGIAEAKKLKKDSSKTVAVVGDGSLTGGMSFEALNYSGHRGSDLLVILNHNNMSISPSVGALGKYLTRMISNPIYNRLRIEVENFLGHLPLAKKFIPKAKKFEERLKGLIIPGMFFEELGFRYFGPIDGHNLEEFIPTLRNLISLKGPKILHVITKKGKGYRIAEEKPELFHGVSVFDPETGNHRKTKEITFSQIFAAKLVDLAKVDKRIVAITAAMPEGTGLSLFKQEIPDRFFDVGIAEAHAVGLASGLAKEGKKPVVAIYSTFLQRCYDQIIHDVALQNVPVVFAIDRAGLVGPDGPTHHGVFDIGFIKLIPNIIFMAPKDKKELQDSLQFALSCNQPTAIRYPKGESFSLGRDEPIELGKSQILSEGKDLAIMALGSMLKEAMKCRQILAKDKISIGVVNARFIKPLDESLLIELFNKYKILVTIEEGSLSGGWGQEVTAYCFNKGNHLKTKIVNLGLPDQFIPAGKRKELFCQYGLDAKSLAEKIKAIIAK
ncbi:MAG: 1-deoxy-D-xylulose-5-phosphate synthase [Candidatus Omnitrophica bacterium]|nr:1-deoxy-D-xylulose-5-phosphate synthase [Candidatus Omnitrophota bacterium]MCF7895132.1 1-deoxy-D-xylulose-5-phosphate synthase [Candidatus Omnitrophota bacterium]